MNSIKASILPKTIPAGGKWSGRISRGRLITFKTLGDRANLSMLLYNADDTAERYNMPDTLKAQHTSHLTKGNVLMSDNGRVLASIVEDTVGWHDTITGYSSKRLINEKYGLTTYQENRNNWYRSGEENLLIELFRNGLTSRDLVPVVNLFSKIYCDEAGNLRYVPGHAEKGDTITLRTEMDIIIILSNTPNPFDTSGTYPLTPIEFSIADAVPIQGNDVCLNHCEENRRAFENTWDYECLTKGEMK